MNKRVFVSAAVAVIAADLILWIILRASPAVHNNGFLSSLVQAALTLLGFPVRLYVVFVLGENGSWGISGLPILIALLIASGAFWGFLIERVCRLLRRGHSSTL